MFTNIYNAVKAGKNVFLNEKYAYKQEHGSYVEVDVRQVAKFLGAIKAIESLANRS